MNLQKELQKVKEASRKLSLLSDEKIRSILKRLADKLEKETEKILKANTKDLAKIDSADHIYDRILLNEKRIKEITKSIREIAEYNSPIGQELEKRKLKNGLEIKKITVPLGVVGAIFEARPNVIMDIFTLCFKSKNACVMKGGSDCEETNKILEQVIRESLGEWKNVILLLPNDRTIIDQFLKADQYIDVIIPRGSENLIRHVRQNSTIPMIETGRGVCHIFIDEFADENKSAKIIFNAKTQRPGVCNALDTMIIHEKKLGSLEKICTPLLDAKVEIFADEKSYEILKKIETKTKKNTTKKLLKKAVPGHFGTEFLSLKMSIKTVKNLDEAVVHINQYGSGHSEAIITENKKNAEKFLKQIDAACVYVNASTRFTDGGEFGLGAEVGVSTQKLHARGPMGIKELTSYKWEIRGEGQVR